MLEDCKPWILSIVLLVMSISFYGQSAEEIMQRTDEKMRGKTSIAQMVLRTIRPTWSREIKVQVWMKGTDKALLLIQSPIKEKGVAFLKRNKEVWNWLPSLEKLIKLPPSMMSQSWMGTDFTNDDLDLVSQHFFGQQQDRFHSINQSGFLRLKYSF